jgi:hypothetical protein
LHAPIDGLDGAGPWYLDNRGVSSTWRIFMARILLVEDDHYSDMGKFATALGTRTGVWYEKRDRLYVAAPPSGVLGARLLVFEAQTD